MDLLREFEKIAILPAEQASALPYAVYQDSGFYEHERDQVFHRDWVFVCNRHVLKNPGDRFAVTIAGEPVVIIHGKDGVLRALSNACRHRGTPIADEGYSQGTNLTCPYHSWNYSDQGKLRGAPFTGTVEIDKDAHCLPQFALEDWHGLLFVNIDCSAEPLSERYKDIEPYLEHFDFDKASFGAEMEPEFWDSNWKLVMENAMESYHLFKVHEPTLETITPTKGAFYVEGNGLWALTAGEMTRYSDVLKSMINKPKKGPKDHYLLLMLPPSFVGIAQADGSCGYLAMLPDGPQRTYTRGGAITTSEANRSKQEEEFTSAFFAEDKWICERAFKGMGALHSSGGQLVELERVVADFHRYLAIRLCNADAGASYRNPETDERLLP